MNDYEPLYNWIGRQIAQYRKAKNLSQTDLAELMQLSRGSVANIEKGRQQSPLHVLWNIADHLGVTIDKLLPLEGEHLKKNTTELISQIDQMDDLNEESKKLISQFIENNL